jgi:hypothetical protein
VININIKRLIAVLLVLTGFVIIYWALFLRIDRADASQIYSNSFTIKPSCTPKPSSSPSASPSVSPSPEPSVEPSATPESTPEARLVSDQGFTAPQGPFNAPAQPACVEIKFAPTVDVVKRIDADSVWIRWTSVDEGINHYKIEYSLFKGFVMWNTIVENTNEKDLNFLPDWLPIWVRVAGVSPGGCVGPYSVWIDP